LDPGILFDLSIGTLSAQDIEHFQRWATYLADDPGVRPSARCWANPAARIIGTHRAGHGQPHTDHNHPAHRFTEEIVGVRLGRDLEHLVPSELALLADPDTALLFDLKYVEARLMCFDMQDCRRGIPKSTSRKSGRRARPTSKAR
jgi:uncharacterized protein with von Willebrand factor type A (vWA) domain